MPTQTSAPAGAAHLGFALALVAAAALPPLLAYNQTPAATLYNQLLALAGWGLALLLSRNSAGEQPACLCCSLALVCNSCL